MALGIQGMLGELKKIREGLNAGEIRKSAARELRIGMAASSEETIQAMERFLGAGPLYRVDLTSENGADGYDLVLCEARVSLGPMPSNGYRFDSHDPEKTAAAILTNREDLELALARNFPVFRPMVAERIIYRISAENALFSLVSALPDVIPNLLELPWSVAEFATDTAFITMNQIRLALSLAAAYDRPVGYLEQKLQLAAIAGSAFGWRALARELAGKIPFGGGLIAKAGISFAGTWVVGLGLERINRLGRGLTPEERREAYTAALDRGKEFARNLVPESLRVSRNGK